MLGEAVGGLSPAVLDRAPGLPWRQMRGLRHLIAHEYFRADTGILHQVVTVDLPTLIPELEALLNSPDWP